MDLNSGGEFRLERHGDIQSRRATGARKARKHEHEYSKLSLTLQTIMSASPVLIWAPSRYFPTGVFRYMNTRPLG